MIEWITAESSVQGTSHEKTSTPCQDFFVIDTITDSDGASILIIAVADGAGSAPKSDIGSCRACTNAVLYIKSAPEITGSPECWNDLLRDAFLNCAFELEKTAKAESTPARDYATTLQVAVISDKHIAMGQVGDGAMFWGEDDNVSLFHWHESEAINLTDFLSSKSLDQTLTVATYECNTTHFASTTDGLIPLLIDYKTKSPHQPLIHRLFETCSKSPDSSRLSDDLKQFMSSDIVNDKTDDDKTLVLAVRL